MHLFRLLNPSLQFGILSFGFSVHVSPICLPSAFPLVPAVKAPPCRGGFPGALVSAPPTSTASIRGALSEPLVSVAHVSTRTCISTSRKDSGTLCHSLMWFRASPRSAARVPAIHICGPRQRGDSSLPGCSLPARLRMRRWPNRGFRGTAAGREARLTTA